MGMGKHIVEMSEAERERAVQTARELAPEFDKVGKDADERNEFPFSLVPLYKEAGLAGIGVPKRFGGGGADIWTLARISYELAKGDPACALAFNMHQVMVGILRGLMSEEQQELWMTRVASRTRLMGGHDPRCGGRRLQDHRPQGVGGAVGGRRPGDLQRDGHQRGWLAPGGPPP